MCSNIALPGSKASCSVFAFSAPDSGRIAKVLQAIRAKKALKKAIRAVHFIFKMRVKSIKSTFFTFGFGGASYVIVR